MTRTAASLARPRTTLDDAPAPTPEAQAYERVRSAFDPLADADLRFVNVNVPAAVAIIKAAVTRLDPLRPTFAAHVPLFDATVLDRLPDYADALAFLEASCAQPKAAPSASAPDGFAEASELREALLLTARLLVSLGHADADLLDGVTCRKDCPSVGQDLVHLSSRLLEAPQRLRHRCPFSAAQLRHGVALGQRMLAAKTDRELAAEHARWLHRERQRAFTVCARAYDQVRAAVHYVRWEAGDASAFAPALIPGKARRPADPLAADACAGSARGGVRTKSARGAS